MEDTINLTQTPEESLVQTVLVNSGRFELVDDDLRYIDYSRANKGSPRTLSVADLPLMAGGRYHFARKFDPGRRPRARPLDARLGMLRRGGRPPCAHLRPPAMLPTQARERGLEEGTT